MIRCYTSWQSLMFSTLLGRTDVQVSRLGVGVMTWGAPKGLARWTPATLAYGAAHGAAEEQQATERQRVRAHYPLQASGGEVEIGGDRR